MTTLTAIFKAIVLNTLELYILPIAACIALVVTAIRLRRPWLILLAHMAISAYVLWSEGNADVPDRDLVFMFGVCVRLLLANAFLLVGYLLYRLILVVSRSCSDCADIGE
jgi:hypothetical protein